ncbi:MAG: UbiD family decarboxylase [Candidatus Bathyarchaeia archaeon]|jgi:UbiD family decarboxylase
MELAKFANILEQKGLLTKISRSVDPRYEISTLMRMLDGRVLLFDHVKGFSMPIIANVCSTRDLVAIGLGTSRDQLIGKLTEAIDHPKKAKLVDAEGYVNIGADLNKLPILTHYPKDGGPYISSGVVASNDEEYGVNLSYHRAQVLEKDLIVLRILERHFDTYIKRGLKEFAICISSSIQVLVSAAISVNIGISEVEIANVLEETPLMNLDGYLVPPSDIVIMAELTGELREEGPFLDLTETFDIVRKQRVARVKKIYAREGAMYHALLPGGLEHKVLMGMPREPTIYREVAKVCDVRDVLVTPGGCSWLHGVVSIRKKSPDDGRKAIEAAFNGHKSMKHVFIVNDDINIHDPNEIEWAMATRFQADKNMIIKREKGSSLDPSSDMDTQMTCKVGFDLTIPEGGKKEFKRPELPMKLLLDNYIARE